MPVPAGWEPKLDQSSGKIYFWNTVTNATQWDRPTELADPVAMSRLMLRQAAFCPWFTMNYFTAESLLHQEPTYTKNYVCIRHPLCVLVQAAAAAADFVRCPESVGDLAGYNFRDGDDGVGYYRRGNGTSM